MLIVLLIDVPLCKDFWCCYC